MKFKGFGAIYRIHNTITGKSYVGQTFRGTKRRMIAHKSLLNAQKHHSSKLQKEWTLYGEDTFEFEVLWQETCDETQLDELEIAFIGKYHGYTEGYNMSRGGDSKGSLTPLEDKEYPVKLCIVCGVGFLDYSYPGTAKYCGPKCRRIDRAHRNNRTVTGETVMLTCVNCLAPFEWENTGVSPR